MQTFLSFLSLVFLLLVSSCSPVLYSNTGYVVPLFKQKGEASANVAYGDTEDAQGIAVQLAAAPLDHWLVTGSVYSMEDKGSTNWQGKGTYVEFAAGRFGTFGDLGTGIAEGLVGVGFGKIENDFDGQRVHLTYVKSFLQPSLALSLPSFELAFTPRVCLVSFTDNVILVDDIARYYEAERFFREKRNTLVFEPGLTIRAGYKGIKGQLQYTISTFSEEFGENDANINNQFLSLGLNVLISRRFKTTR